MAWRIEYRLLPDCGLFEDKMRIEPFKKSLTRGDIFIPIVIHQGVVIDGRHKLEAARQLNWEKIPVAHGVNGPGGKVSFDGVYFPLIAEIEKLEDTEQIKIDCLNCGATMKPVVEEVACSKCHRKTRKRNKLGLTVINL